MPESAALYFWLLPCCLGQVSCRTAGNQLSLHTCSTAAAAISTQRGK
jgi:hypothetical protein